MFSPAMPRTTSGFFAAKGCFAARIAGGASPDEPARESQTRAPLFPLSDTGDLDAHPRIVPR